METNPITVVDNYTLASPVQRILAMIIDYVLAAGFMLILFPFSPALAGILSASYLVFRDSFPFLNYQSAGKRIMKIKVIKKESMKISWRSALKRNFIFLPALLNAFGISFIYVSGGVILLLVLIEIYLLFTSSDTQRLGDSFADTLVIEAFGKENN